MRSRVVFIGGGIVALVASFFVGRYTCQATTAPAATQPPAITKPSGPTLAERLALATGKKRDGVENPLIRQLMENVGFVTDEKEKFKGNPSDQAAVKEWAGWETHRIAIKAGYVDPHHPYAWIALRTPDRVAYLLDKDAQGNIVVKEYVAASDNDFGTSPQPREIHQLAKSFSQAQFLGWPDNVQQHPLPAYEYLYTGGVI